MAIWRCSLKIMNKKIASIIGFVSLPNIALGFDYTGLAAAMYLMVVVGTTTLLNILLISSFSLLRKYEAKRFSLWHTSIALLFPCVGIVISIFDHATMNDLWKTIMWNILSVLIALIPLVIYQSYKNKSHKG